VTVPLTSAAIISLAIDAVCRVLTHDGTVEEVVTDDSPGDIYFAEPDTRILYGG
jgi:hypothetical protein